MNTELKSKTINLEENQIFSLKKVENVSVTSGKLWITIDGDSEDYFYKEGDSFEVPNGRHTVIQALGRASFWF